MHIPLAPLKPATPIVHLADGPAADAKPAAAAATAAVIGKVMQTEGNAWITHEGVKQAARADMPVFERDTVETADGAQVSLVFADRSTFVLKDKGALALDEFVYDPNHHTGKETFLIAQGAFNFVSGDIAKTVPEAAVLHTPTVSIGIRGTTVAGVVGSEGVTSVALEADPGSNFVGEISVGRLGGGSEVVVINTENSGILGAAGTAALVVTTNAAAAIAAAVPPPMPPPAVAPVLPAAPTPAPEGDHGAGSGQHGDVAPPANVLHTAAPEAVAPPPVIVPPPALPAAAPSVPVDTTPPFSPPAAQSPPAAAEAPPPPPLAQQQSADIVTAALSGGGGYEGHTVTGAIIGNDSAGQPLAYHVIDAAGNPLTSLAGTLGTLTINPATGAYTYVPSGNQVGTDTFTVRVDNGHGVSIDETVPITLAANPIAAPGQSVSSVNGSAVSGVVAASDPAGDTMVYSLATPNGGAQHGTVTLTGADYTYTPSPGLSGTDSFQITVSDGHGGSTTETITVTDPQTTVTTSTSGGSGYEGHSVTGQVSGNDGAPRDTMSYHLLNGSGDPVTSLAGSLGTMTIDPTTGAYSYVPSSDQTGTDSFKVQVANGHGQSADQSVLITLAANPVTVTGPQSVSSFNGAAVFGSIVISDPAGDAVTYALDQAYGGPQHGTVTLSGGDYTYIPTPGYSGIDRFEITEAIGGGSAAQIITVTDTQPTVTTSASGGSGYEGHTVTGQVSGGDGMSEDTMSYHVLDGSGNPVTSLAGALGTMTIDPTTGAYSYAPSGNQVGTDTFTVLVANGHGVSADQTVAITLAANPITATGQSALNLDGAAVSGVVAASDPAGDTMAYSLATPNGGSQHGTVTLTGADYTYTPTPGYVGSDSFQIAVSDGHGGTGTETIAMTDVNAVHGIHVNNTIRLGVDGAVDIGTNAANAINSGSFTAQVSFMYTGDDVGNFNKCITAVRLTERPRLETPVFSVG